RHFDLCYLGVGQARLLQMLMYDGSGAEPLFLVDQAASRYGRRDIPTVAAEGLTRGSGKINPDSSTANAPAHLGSRQLIPTGMPSASQRGRGCFTAPKPSLAKSIGPSLYSVSFLGQTLGPRHLRTGGIP